MSKSSMTRSITVLFVLIISVALVTADLIFVSAQNSNSSTTQNSNDEQTRGAIMTTQNGNTSNTGSRRGRRRRSTRRTSNTSADTANANMSSDTSTTDANANMSADTSSNTNMSGDMTGMGGGRRRRRRGRRSAAAVTTADAGGLMQTGATERTDGGMQEDLAGQSYTGTANYPDGGVNGPATLTFDSGGQFTLTPEGGTAMSGRYSAVTTRGYTGVTMMFSGSTPATIVSVRLRKMGNGVSIMSVPGETRQFSFTSSGGGGGMAMSGGGRRRARRKKRGRRTRGMPTGIKPPMANPEPSATP